MKRAVVAVLLGLMAVSAVSLLGADKHRVIFSRVGPVRSQLFLANGDGSGERALLPETGLDYSANLSTDQQWVVFTSERDGSSDLYRIKIDGSGLERLTNDPAYDDQAAFSPDARTIAFVSSREGGRAHIWLLDVASRRARPLTSGAGGDFRPSWSRDGQWIAFTSDRDTHAPNRPGRWEHLQSTRLYVVRADGSGLRALTRGRGVAGSPHWYADGQKILYYETTELGAWNAAGGDARQGATQVVRIDVSTGARTELTSGDGARFWPQPFAHGGFGYLTKLPGGEAQLRTVSATGATTEGPSGQIRSPSWSADGQRVVYHKIIPRNDLAMIPAFSKDADFDLTRLVGGTFPAFSPRGDQVAAGVNRPPQPTRTDALVRMNPDGTSRQVFLDRPGVSAFAPAWSPDGKQVAFSLGQYFRAPGHPSADVGLINTDGTGLTTIADDGSNNGFASWSPDGKRIVYRKDEHLVTLSLADKSLTNLTAPGPQHDNFPQWSPKGDWIAFTSDRGADEDFRIYLVRPDGSGLRQLTSSPGDAHSAWSPDGEWVIFSSAKMGFKDERGLLETIPQPYGELFIVRPDGTGLRQLTDNQWEDATPTWMPAASAGRSSPK